MTRQSLIKYALVFLVISLGNVSVANDVIEGVWIVEDGDGLIEFQWQDNRSRFRRLWVPCFENGANCWF